MPRIFFISYTQKNSRSCTVKELSESLIQANQEDGKSPNRRDHTDTEVWGQWQGSGGVCREYNISVQSYYRWKKKYGGMELKDAQRYRELERENTELKKMLADQMLKNRVLEEVASKKW